MEDSKIKKALKRLENAELKVIIRGGEITKIPQQDIELSIKDGVQIIYKIGADICEE